MIEGELPEYRPEEYLIPRELRQIFRDILRFGDQPWPNFRSLVQCISLEKEHRDMTVMEWPHCAIVALTHVDPTSNRIIIGSIITSLDPDGRPLHTTTFLDGEPRKSKYSRYDEEGFLVVRISANMRSGKATEIVLNRALGNPRVQSYRITEGHLEYGDDLCFAGTSATTIPREYLEELVSSS